MNSLIENNVRSNDLKTHEYVKRQELIDISLRLLKLGLVVRTWGNMSLRLDDRHILITPSGIRYEDLEQEDIVCVEIDSGKVLSDNFGQREASSELPVHLAYYRLMTDTQVVLHTHQIYGSALSLYGEDVEAPKELSEQINCKVVPISAYGISGSRMLHNNVEEKIDSSGSSIILMEKHGVLARGISVEETISRLEALEDWCEKKYRAIVKKAIENDCLKKEISKRRIFPYLDDFAQICGVEVDIGGKDVWTLERDMLTNEKMTMEILSNVNHGDLDSAKHVFFKNLKARVVGIARGVEPLSKADGEFMRWKYKESYSRKADIKGKNENI
ncbi:MAG: class II aldolase/adducin family protein [Clostridiales bacterium]|nr:class II aldolase/adducin family protein [Clostridiales bacterium]